MKHYFGLWTSILVFHFSSHPLMDWIVLDYRYCDAFISCLDSHSDGTHSLQM